LVVITITVQKIKTIYSIKKSNTRLLIALSIGIIVLVGYFITINYFTWLQKSKEEVLHRLMAITQTAALQIDGDAHQRISDEFMGKDDLLSHEQDIDYLVLHKQLLGIKNANSLKTPIYTIVYYARDSTFHFIGTSSEKPYYRHRYKHYPRNLLVHLQTGGILDTYEDENGTWLSAFSPIKNKKGEVVGLLEADEHFEWFIEKARTELLKNSLISLGLIVPFGFLLYNVFSRAFKKQEQDQELLVVQKEEIETQNEEIKTQNDFIETQNKQLEWRVKQRTSELELSNNQLANFLYHSSHDVQAPIATIKGLHSLATKESTEENVKVYLTLISETITKLERMVKTIQLVHFIKTKEVAIEEVELQEAICSIYKKAAENSQNCRLELNLNQSKIKTDSFLLQTAILEIIKNSLQYNNDNPNLIIKVTQQTEKRFNTISIEDNGIGITTDARNELFKMFKRGNEKSTGIGLGLYIVQTCLKRMGGEILASDCSVGASFKIQLPAND